MLDFRAFGRRIIVGYNGERTLRFGIRHERLFSALGAWPLLIGFETIRKGARVSTHALPCIKCGKPLKNVDADIENQPGGGTEFVARGHYGSTIHDPVGEDDPLVLVLNVCDTCILRAIDVGAVQSRSKGILLSRHPITPEGRAWVLAQNEKAYGSAWGEDVPVDYRAEMIKAGWPEEQLDDE